MFMKIISEESIENLKKLIRNRNSYLDIKEVLENLENYRESRENDIIKDLKDLLHSRAKSTILEIDIKDIINKYGDEDENNK